MKDKEKEKVIDLIDKETKKYIRDQQKQKTFWTTHDFKLINNLKHKLINKIGELE